MIYALLAMALLCVLLGCVWAVGVGSTVHDHEQECRNYYEWEEME